jgi:hypothetical protein
MYLATPWLIPMGTCACNYGLIHHHTCTVSVFAAKTKPETREKPSESSFPWLCMICCWAFLSKGGPWPIGATESRHRSNIWNVSPMEASIGNRIYQTIEAPVQAIEAIWLHHIRPMKNQVCKLFQPHSAFMCMHKLMRRIKNAVCMQEV